MAFLTLEKLFDDKQKYDIPARVSRILDTGVVFVHFFLKSDVSITKKISFDKTTNCFLQGFKKTDTFKVGDTLLVKCKGLILNQFLEKGALPEKASCHFIEKLDNKNYDIYVNKLDKDRITKILAKIEEQEKKTAQLETKITTKLNQIKEIDSFQELKNNLTKTQKEKQQLEQYLQQLKNDVQKYQWAESVKHHFSLPTTQTDYSHEKLNDIIPQIKSIQNELTNNLGLNTDFANCYLFSLLTALLNGRFLLLTGHIGTGKSHLIKQSGTLFGGETNMVAVRPAWLDSSDLLGYFDPLNNKYHATDFVRYLSKKNNNRLHMILLDEMNIARIENYGADILANLSPIFNNQRQAKSNQIKLYPTDMQEMLFLQKLYHESKDKLSEEKQKEFKQLLQQYQAKSAISIANNVLICGTLNIDGSTENLSPKMIDRSLILKFPDFDGKLTVAKEIVNIDMPISALLYQLGKPHKYHNKWEVFYSRYLKDIKDYFLPISRRVAEDYLLFQQINNYFKITEDNKTLNQYFFYSRILPRLRIEQINNDIKNRLKNKLQGDLFKVFLQEIQNSENGEFIDYQHICG